MAHLLFTLLFIYPYLACASFKNDEEKIVPEHKIMIPANSPQANDITEKEFDEILNWFLAKTVSKVKNLGGELVIEKDWDESIANASARRDENKWVIRVLGGMARHPLITKDAFILILCHELAHHMGGAPKKRDLFSVSWSSIEGQADYWASAKCFPELFEKDDNFKEISKQFIPPLVKTKCEKNHLDQKKSALCIRNALAGLSVAKFYNRAENENRPVQFETPDKSIVKKTNQNHPAPQCRLDTHFQGALCTVDWRIPHDQTDVYQGFCNHQDGHEEGARPQCWFKEE